MISILLSFTLIQINNLDESSIKCYWKQNIETVMYTRIYLIFLKLYETSKALINSLK